jgi:phosphatidylglycerophosphatase A
VSVAIAAPSFGFLVSHPAHFVALGFGAGLAPRMPGTFGTLVALPIAWALRMYAGDGGWLLTIAALTSSARGPRR